MLVPRPPGPDRTPRRSNARGSAEHKEGLSCVGLQRTGATAVEMTIEEEAPNDAPLYSVSLQRHDFENETLATFYDQRDARVVWEKMQTDIPDECVAYWDGSVDLLLEEAERANSAFRTQLVRERLLRAEEFKFETEDIHCLWQTQDDAQYKTVAVAFKRLSEDMSSLGRQLSTHEAMLCDLRSELPRSTKVKAAVKTKLELSITVAREAERKELNRIHFECQQGSLCVGELTARRCVERAWDATHLRLRLEAVHDCQLVRVAEDETAARFDTEEERHSAESAFLHLLKKCKERNARQLRIKDLEEQLAR
ncbi:hypothetical protein DIPPA_65506 [Diplonema papillatum]|nr:hypothetical protein DIPPA_65506 [Diplonema papillatum]